MLWSVIFIEVFDRISFVRFFVVKRIIKLVDYNIGVWVEILVFSIVLIYVNILILVGIVIIMVVVLK